MSTGCVSPFIQGEKGMSRAHLRGQKPEQVAPFEESGAVTRRGQDGDGVSHVLVTWESL